jgi:hypothetical protein
MDTIDMKKRVVVAGSCGGGISLYRETRLCGDWKPSEPQKPLTADTIFDAIEKMKSTSKPSLHARLIELIIHAQRCIHGGFLEYGFITIEEIERQIREITNQMEFTERDNACDHALKIAAEHELRKIIWQIKAETQEERGQAKLAKEADHGPDVDV